MIDFLLSTELKQTITADLALNYRVIPIYSDINSIKFKTDKVSNKLLSQELEILFDKNIELITEDSHVIDKFLTINYRTKSQNNSVSNIIYTEDFLEKISFSAAFNSGNSNSNPAFWIFWLDTRFPPNTIAAISPRTSFKAKPGTPIPK